MELHLKGRNALISGAWVGIGLATAHALAERSRALLQARAKANFGDAERWPELLRHLPFGRPASQRTNWWG